jgi:vacuolar-type H+-ATPase subunit E/Vma4
MPLEEILNRIESETQKEEEAVILQSREEAKKILADAEKQADLIYDSFRRRAIEDADAMKRRMISSSTLEGRMRLEKAIEDIENEYLQKLTERIAEFKGSEEYYSFLKRKIEVASDMLGPGSIAYVNTADERRLKEMGISFQVVPMDVDPLGGAIVTTSDGKLVVDLTFKEILREKREKILKLVRDSIR